MIKAIKYIFMWIKGKLKYIGAHLKSLGWFRLSLTLLAFSLATIFIISSIMDAPGIHKGIFSKISDSGISKEWAAALAVLFSLFIILTFVGVFLILYLFFKRKYPKLKIRVELVFFLIIFVVNIAIKLTVFLVEFAPQVLGEQLRFDLAISSFLKMVYTSIGGIQFEGLTEIINLSPLGYSLYYSSSIIFGICSIILITLKAGYEIYSYLQLHFLSSRFTKLSNNVYVFNDLNLQTFNIANSIKERDNPSDIIVFTGPSLEPFDRKNELCSECMGRGYLYWSYPQNNRTNIPKVLGAAGRKKINDTKSEFYIFAFEVDNNGRAKEEENAQFVFDDISHRNDELFITYVILAKDNIHYYPYRLLFNIKESQNGRNDILVWSETIGIANQLASLMKLNPILDDALPESNETYMWSIGFGKTGQRLAKEIYVQSTNETIEGASSYFTCLAFDKDGRKQLESLRNDVPLAICQPIKIVNERFGIKKEEGEIALDKNLSSILSLDSYADSSITSRSPTKLNISSAGSKFPAVNETVRRLNEKINDSLHGAVQGSSSHTYKDKEMPLKGEYNYKMPFNKGMPYPLFLAVDIDDYKVDYGEIGWEIDPESAPKYIVIALGDDRKNIDAANMLIKKFSSRLPTFKTIIFVEIINRKNNFLVRGYDSSRANTKKEKIITYKDEQGVPKLFVCIIGNRRDTFDFNYIIYNNEVKKINDRYVSLSALYNNNLDAFTPFNHSYKHETYSENKDNIKGIRDSVTQISNMFALEDEFKNPDPEVLANNINSKDLGVDVSNPVNEELMLNRWRKTSLWRKYSSYMNFIFSHTHMALLQNSKEKDKTKFDDIVANKTGNYDILINHPFIFSGSTPSFYIREQGQIEEGDFSLNLTYKYRVVVFKKSGKKVTIKPILNHKRHQLYVNKIELEEGDILYVKKPNGKYVGFYELSSKNKYTPLDIESNKKRISKTLPSNSKPEDIKKAIDAFLLEEVYFVRNNDNKGIVISRSGNYTLRINIEKKSFPFLNKVFEVNMNDLKDFEIVPLKKSSDVFIELNGNKYFFTKGFDEQYILENISLNKGDAFKISYHDKLKGFNYLSKTSNDFSRGDLIISKDILYRLARIEHQRWMRTHIIDGWKYKKMDQDNAPTTYLGDDTRERNKEHNCLVPFQEINKNKYRNDITNVLVSLQSYIEFQGYEEKKVVEDINNADETAQPMLIK